MNETNPEPEDLDVEATESVEESSIEAEAAADPAADAEAEAQQFHERWIRSQAELENYRKRAQKEMEELRRYQSQSIIRDLLPGLDNLERAVSAAESSNSVEELLEGIRMVQKQFDSALASHGATPIECVGQTFDPNLHEAVQQMPSPDFPAMTVMHEMERGYVIADRVIRPSKVIVSTGAPE